MAEKRTTQIVALRRAVDCLPVRTRHAMLSGIDNNTIVVGAYTIDGKGVCPMLAAHRAGGRTNFASFARAWDEFCFRGVRKGRRRPRLATSTELATLRAHIEASLLVEEQIDLAAAVAEHRDLSERRLASEQQAAREHRLAEQRAAENARMEHEMDVQRERELEAARGHITRPERVRPGDPDRSGELSRRPGWRWLRVMRSYDEYEQALAALAQAEARSAAEAERELIHSRD
jgi:hypothetical protein